MNARLTLILVSSFCFVLVARHAAGATVNEGSQSSSSGGGVSAPLLTRVGSNGTTSSFDHGSDSLSRGSIIAEDETESESGPGDDEYEGEDPGDEYADELRAVAESHEAMSRRNEQANQTQHRSHPSQDSGEKFETPKKDFDSKEKSVESGSDESDSSNETLVDGGEPEDEEVSQLMKYKNTNHFRLKNDGAGDAKKKRVPTVKKELSTQPEIKSGVNASESEVEKRFKTKELLDELDKEFKDSDKDDGVPCDSGTTPISKEGLVDEKSEDLSEDGEVDDYLDGNSPPESDNLHSESRVDLDSEELEEPRKLDKRQEAVLRDLETYLRAEYAAEQEQQQKLQELGAQEGALAESLLELLVKLAENPRRWERVHRLLMDVEGGLELSRQALEARKRAFNLTSTVATTTTSPSTTSKKPRKKPKKKKKKKQKHHRFATTTTTVPTTPLLTTTEAPWLTTPMQWRLVAERLFGPPWPQDLQDDPGLAKVRFTVPSSSRTSPPSREFVGQLNDRKELDEHKALNNERQALMLESSREYTQPRHVHYGKVNTHQGATSHREQSPAGNYHGSRDGPRVRDYDPPERTSPQYQDRYAQYDYRGRIPEDQLYPVPNYAQNHEYRPPGRDYAATQGWHEAQYKFGRPSWKSQEPQKWTWPQIDEQKPSWHREYWPRVQNDGWDRAWQRQDDEGSRNPPWEVAKIRTESSKQGVEKPKSKPKSKPKIHEERNAWTSGMDTNPKIWPPKAAMSPKIQSVGAWVMPVDQSTWKPYNLEDPPRPRWSADMDTNPRTWPPKMVEENWNKFGKPSNPVAWPKWKQFAYHRVTAMPILAGSPIQEGTRARNNAYIAVSAVSPKYNGNQWRKNDIEETPVDQGVSNRVGSAQDSEHPVSQLRAGARNEVIYTWKKDGSEKIERHGGKANTTSPDPLEDQLEELRRGASWSHNENRDNIKKQLNEISDASETLASRFATNSSVNKPEIVTEQQQQPQIIVNEDNKNGDIDQIEQLKIAQLHN